MKWLEWPLMVADRITAITVGLMLVIITLVLFVNATGRYFADIAIVGGEELARCLMVWMTFLGSYLLVRTQAHIAIDILSSSLEGRARRMLTVALCALGVVVTLYFAVLGYDLTVRIFSSGQRMSSLPLARGWFYLPVPIGMALMMLAFLQRLCATVTGLAQPKPSDFILDEREASAGAAKKLENS
jgi:TRAP-type C4-dicarboxylate transport system permease small subunit